MNILAISIDFFHFNYFSKIEKIELNLTSSDQNFFIFFFASFDKLFDMYVLIRLTLIKI